MKTFKYLTLLIIILCVCGKASKVISAQSVAYKINPLYSHFFKDKPFGSFKALELYTTPIECSSYQEFKSAIKEKSENRVTQFSIHLVYNFSFSEVLDIWSQAIDEIMAEDDYLAFSYTMYSATFSGYDGDVIIHCEAEYLTTYDEEQLVSQKTNEILDVIITDEMNNEEKEKEIHDWIVLNVEYDTSYNEYTAYSALFLGTAVCQGYALLTFKMLEEARIEAKIINGSSKDEDHAWNMVYLCGNWYHLDTTWDDPVPDVQGQVLYDYFNKSDDEMASDHIWVAEDYPAATVSYYEGVCSDQSTNQAPTAPSLSVTIDGTVVTLTWNSVLQADGYTLFYAPYPDASYIGSVDMGNQTNVSFDLWGGAAFYVAVQAYNTAGSSDYSNIDYFVIPSL